MLIAHFRLGAELDGNLKAESKSSHRKRRGEVGLLGNCPAEVSTTGCSRHAALAARKGKCLHCSTSESWLLPNSEFHSDF